MIGLTHAIGGASMIMGANFIFPSFFNINFWLIILSFYAAQLPDIDIKKSTISKNIFVMPFRLLLSPLIDGHRAKQTHSLFGTAIFMLIILPIIGVFGLSGWILLGLAYFSHIFLDYFNPTGVKLFYFPILNNNPRAWSLYNTGFLLALEIPYYLKYILFFLGKIIKRKMKVPVRKEIKFDGVGVMTGQKFEKVITYILWITFSGLMLLNIDALSNTLRLDALILSSFPIVAAILYLTILIQEKEEISKIKGQTFIAIIIGIFLVFLIKTGAFNSTKLSILKDITYYGYTIIILIIALIPLFVKLFINLIKNLFSFTKMIIPTKESTSYFNSAIDYSTLTHTFILIILIASVFQIDIYEQSIIKINQTYATLNKDNITDSIISTISNQYKSSYSNLINDTNTLINSNTGTTSTTTGAIDKPKTAKERLLELRQQNSN